MLHKVPSVTTDTVNPCPKCNHPYPIDLLPFHRHADMCDYTRFVNIEAPKLGYEDLCPHIDADMNGNDLMAMFDKIGIKYVAFSLHSPINRGHQIFVEPVVVQAIRIFEAKDNGFADMTLEEWLCRMLGFGTPE